ncbi:COQ9 family protein [Kordiimonas pumila]|uniref:COQ9 family protein n=1 Tax=Kordiimonas pumila TaxID=2161677 RepID=A0ABV7D7K6_9PROT|nr:COQ9 family protein [Kordiimonas pumila]
MTCDKTPEELRQPLLKAMLLHVPFDGWSVKSLKAAASDIGISFELAELAFPRGAIEVLEYHLTEADALLAAELAEMKLPTMKIRDRITIAIRTRLTEQLVNREAVRRGLATLALPQNIALGSKALWNTADIMWRAAGDTSTDHNWYTKRATLCAVYSAVLLYWLNDDSDGYTETWAFLDRRIEDVMKIEKTKYDMRRTTAHIPSLSRFLGRLRYPQL